MNKRRRGVPVALWSEIFALWRDHARRPALPLLLAMLLFVFAPLTASVDCSLEMGGHSHEASTSHGDAATDDHHAHDAAAMADDHHAHDAATPDDHAPAVAPQVISLHGAMMQAPAMCCSCSGEPVNANVIALSAPHHSKADSHAVIYAVVNALPVYRVDALEGLHSRAGPRTGKPQLLSLASLTGRAPPVSL